VTRVDDAVAHRPPGGVPAGPVRARNRLAWLSRVPGSGVVGAVIVGVLLLTAALGPLVVSPDPIAQDFDALLAAPSAEHWFGTDELGRDVFSRVVSGARISLLLGLSVILIASFLGTALGLVAGFLGGAVDGIIMRVADLFLAFPKLILAMAVSAALGPSLVNLLIAVSITWWPEYARLARSSALVESRAQYVDAARVLGVTPFRILVRHIVPAALPQTLVKATMDVGFAIVYVAGLSFIGLGVRPPTPEWGVMVSDGRNHMESAWWVATIPGLVILITGLAFNLAGEALRDVIDPKRRAR
jgi:peptide/nickel transport system permease protein